jgi:hypothetical protein
MAGEIGGQMLSGQFPHLYDKNFRKIFLDNYKRYEKEFMPFAKFEKYNEQFVKEGDMVGLGSYKVKPESNPISWDRFEEKNDKTVYFETKALGVQVSREAFDDDRTGKMKKIMSELGKAGAYTQDLDWFDLINDGLATSPDRSGLDGKALFATDHPVYGTGETLSNLVSGSLSQTTLQSAIDLFEGWTNHRGVPIQMKPSILLVPPALKWKAKELLESEYNPDNANMGINTLKNEGLQYRVVHYFSSNTQWALIGKEHDLRFMRRDNLAFQSKEDFNTDAKMYRGRMRYVCDFFNWQGTVASTGA